MVRVVEASRLNFVKSEGVLVNKKSRFLAAFFVRMKGLEPPRLAAPDPKSGAAAITPHPQI